MSFFIKISLYSGFILLVMSSFRPDRSMETAAVRYPVKLSEYQFFKGVPADLLPAENVFPYEINAPLFSDYAEKSRFIYLPEGKTIQYDPKQVFEFPIGSTLIKTFYYPHDAGKPEKGRHILETRLLIREAAGWTALPYIWNDEQTEAFLEVAGGTREVQWKNEKGKKQKISYYVPNTVECKSCHSHDKQLVPIGPSARQLNHSFKDGQNQLQVWQAKGLLSGLPEKDIPQMKSWAEIAGHTLHERARAYLDVNCGHCHNPQGPANTSGMFLDIHTDDPSLWGVNKPPVAAGRGAGGRSYGIVPGQPDASILVHRMESKDPGVMMPEVGRQLVHAEGVELIRDWIGGLR